MESVHQKLFLVAFLVDIWLTRKETCGIFCSITPRDNSGHQRRLPFMSLSGWYKQTWKNLTLLHIISRSYQNPTTNCSLTVGIKLGDVLTYITHPTRQGKPALYHCGRTKAYTTYIVVRLIQTNLDEPDTPTYDQSFISKPYNKLFSNCWHLARECADLHNAPDKSGKAGASKPSYIIVVEPFKNEK